MTSLAAELLGILSDVTAPMRPGSLSRVLHVTGYAGDDGNPIPVEQIDAALEELLVAGQVEQVWRRGTAAYRAMNGGSA